jgi:hypothetical protein
METIQQFTSDLKDKGISFNVENDNVIINEGYVNLSSLTEIPANAAITFNNGGYVDLSSLTAIPENAAITFNNGGHVYLRSLTAIPENAAITFNNGGDVYLNSLTEIPANAAITFNNGKGVGLRSLTEIPTNAAITFNNGGHVDLRSITEIPENAAITFNNGGNVDLRNKELSINKPYLERFKVTIEDDYVILYKRVSKDFKTQEGTKNETTWLPGTIVSHQNWDPSQNECGEGKFHACAKPHWCDNFRSKKDDRYISVKVRVNALYEWTKNPNYPEKIGFREAVEIKEVDRKGKSLSDDNEIK